MNRDNIEYCLVKQCRSPYLGTVMIRVRKTRHPCIAVFPARDAGCHAARRYILRWFNNAQCLHL